MTTRLHDFARNHWFYLILPPCLATAALLHRDGPWATDARLGEAAVLFDWTIFMPALFVLCYRRSLPRRALVLRAAALCCSGIWLAGLIVPPASQHLLLELGPLRMAGIAAIVLVEGLAVIAITRLAFAADPDPAALERQGVPPAIVRLMLMEARFWRWLWRRVRGR